MSSLQLLLTAILIYGLSVPVGMLAAMHRLYVLAYLCIGAATVAVVVASIAYVAR